VLTNDASNLSPLDLEEQRRASRRYWNAHPIATDRVGREPGTRESFEAIYMLWGSTWDADRKRFMQACRGRRILEVGCGIAIDGRVIAQHGGDYYGLDHSLRSLLLARRNFDCAQVSHARKFVNADATRLPFPSEHFDLAMSIGVLMCVPSIADACRELMRVVRPGGSVRVMLYCRRSWHCVLVKYVVAPLIWLMLHVRPLGVLLRIVPDKFRHLYAISRDTGFNADRILAASADTSFAGTDNFIPVSGFFTEREIRELFPGLEEYRFFKKDLKYFPLPFLRRWVEPRCGFFLTMTARKPW
jgi:ubiquinone/menaquinone biosynthesis C-methylase UbiE